jgi:hypothetical protein
MYYIMAVSGSKKCKCISFLARFDFYFNVAMEVLLYEHCLKFVSSAVCHVVKIGFVLQLKRILTMFTFIHTPPSENKEAF